MQAPTLTVEHKVSWHSTYAKVPHQCDVPSVYKVYDEFSDLLRFSSLKGKEISKVMDAIAFAAEKHQHGSRKDADKTPYIIHPIGVALSILKEAKYPNADLLIIALLHDTLEDTDTTALEIENTFGAHIASVVQELTDEMSGMKEKKFDRTKRKKMEIEHAKSLSINAAIVKLSDKLYNMRDLTAHPPVGWPNENFINYATFADEVSNNILSAHQDIIGSPEYDALKYLEDLLQIEITIVTDRCCERPRKTKL